MECDLADQGSRAPAKKVSDRGKGGQLYPISCKSVMATDFAGPNGPAMNPAIALVAPMQIDPKGIRIGEIAHLDLRRGIEMGKAKHCNRRDTRIVSFDQGSE